VLLLIKVSAVRVSIRACKRTSAAVAAAKRERLQRLCDYNAQTRATPPAKASLFVTRFTLFIANTIRSCCFSLLGGEELAEWRRAAHATAVHPEGQSRG
jgi:hypothetical protein